MDELHLKTVTFPDEQGRARTYDYTVLAEGGEYGLRITERGGESCAIPRITGDVSRLDDLCGLLLRGQVTPITLRDVVEDWLQG